VHRAHLDILHEAHVEHLVRLVQHAELERRHIQRSALHKVLHPPGRAHHHVHAAPQRSLLRAHRRAAVHAHRLQAQHGAVFLEVLVHLLGQLARRRQDHDGGGAAGARRRAGQRLQDGQHERQSLSLPRARAADDVQAAHDVREAARREE